MGPESFILAANGWIPNNPRLPVLLYRQVGASNAAGLEVLFKANGWPPQWRNGIFTYHHYHSTAHELLGIGGGSARVMLGGPGAREIALQAGDAVLLPAGTGHCLISSSDHFLVVGAYPPGQRFDICRGAPTDAMRRTIAEVKIPPKDPTSSDKFSAWGRN